MIMLLIQLFLEFFVIGLFTFGGGYAMLSLIQAQVVIAHAWIDESTFTDIVAISQMTPGPVGINCATYIGYDVMSKAGAGHLVCILGSFSTTLAIVLPSFIIMLLIVKAYSKFKSNPLFEGVLSALRPAVVGLIGAAALILIFNVTWSGTPGFSSFDIAVIRDNFPDWKSWLLLGAAFAASWWGKVNPILIILAGGLLGFLLY